MARLELEVGTDVLLLETGDALLLETLVCTPSTIALSLTAYAPSVTLEVRVTPTTLVLNLTSYAPQGQKPRLVTPDTLDLALTPYAPRLWSTTKKLRLHPFAYTEGGMVEL